VIVGLMSQLAAEPVRTFSIGFPVKEFDETHYARTAAERFGTIHEEFSSSAGRDGGLAAVGVAL